MIFNQYADVFHISLCVLLYIHIIINNHDHLFKNYDKSPKHTTSKIH